MFRWQTLALATAFLLAGAQPVLACPCPSEAHGSEDHVSGDHVSGDHVSGDHAAEVERAESDCPCESERAESDAHHGDHDCDCGCSISGSTADRTVLPVLAVSAPKQLSDLVPTAPPVVALSAGQANIWLSTPTTWPRSDLEPPLLSFRAKPTPASLQVFRC